MKPSSRAVGEPGTGAYVAKDRTGPDLDERPLYFIMSPNRAIPAEKSNRSSPLAAAQPLTILSWPEALNASRPSGWLMSLLGFHAKPCVAWSSSRKTATGTSTCLSGNPRPTPYSASLFGTRRRRPGMRRRTLSTGSAPAVIDSYAKRPAVGARSTR